MKTKQHTTADHHQAQSAAKSSTGTHHRLHKLARPARPDKYSNQTKGMNWWNFKIRRMTTGQRYLFIGLIIIIPTLVGFFAGLLIDWWLIQEATYALWGMGLGAVMALLLVYQQLRQLIDTDDTQAK